MELTREGFQVLASLVAEDSEATASHGRLVGFLEGGYDLNGLGESVEATLEAWLNLPKPTLGTQDKPQSHVVKLLTELEKSFEIS